jgi:hypothetical protein
MKSSQLSAVSCQLVRKVSFFSQVHDVHGFLSEGRPSLQKKMTGSKTTMPGETFFAPTPRKSCFPRPIMNGGPIHAPIDTIDPHSFR